ncbi:MAG: AMP-binding protein [Armatimonadota bacterium]
MAIDTEVITEHGAPPFRAPGCVENPPGFTPFPPEEVEQSIASRFAKVAREHADRVAVRYGGRAITYRELDIQSNRLARTLRARFGPDAEPIGLLLGKGIPYFIACLGVWKAGKFVVPLDSRHPQARIARICEDVAAQGLLTDTANQALGESIAGGGALNLETLEFDPCGDPLELAIDPLTPSAIFYTSGSTGQPKGVVQLQRNLLRSVGTYTNNFKYYPDARIGFAYSLTVAISFLIFTTALLTGAGVYPVELLEVGLDGFVGWLRREEITFLQCVPSLFRRLAPAVPPGTIFPHLRIIVLGGELGTRGDAELFRRHFGGHTALGINYGLTECTPLRQYIMRPDDVFTELYLPVGYPVPGMDVRVLDSDGNALPPGEIGEIVLCTRYIADGYWHNPEATVRAFRTDPDDPEARIYYTGDLGSLQADGCLTCHGRKDFQVKIRGYRVEMAEVELALLALPTVKEAVVLARSDGMNEQYLAAYLVPAGEERPATSEVLLRLRERLPEYMIPAAVVWLAEMPQTPTGKIDRLALPAPEFEESTAKYEPPRTPLEETLARIWEEVLSVERVGRQESFFDLGGQFLFYWMARRHYRPGPYAGGMTLFRTMENKRQDDLGWSALIEGPVDIRSVPGTHDTMFNAHNIQALAAEFRACLRRAQGYSDEG